jgi:hypothetical protein
MTCGGDEDHAHLYRCPQRSVWRSTFIAALQTLLTELKTPSELKLLILDSITDELVGTPMSERTEKLQPESLLTWTDFLMGRLDTVWSQRMDLVYQDLPRPRTKPHSILTGQQWSTKVISLLWDQLYSVWKIRSTRQHASTTRRRDDFLHQEAVATTTTFYRQKHKLRDFNKTYLFSTPLEDLIETSTTQLQAWVKTTEPYLAQALKDAKNMALLANRDIREWLTFRPP